MMTTLTERLSGTSVETYQEVSVITLLRDNGGISGAIGLDRKGEMITFLADSTVLATGGGTKSTTSRRTLQAGPGTAMQWGTVQGPN